MAKPARAPGGIANFKPRSVRLGRFSVRIGCLDRYRNGGQYEGTTGTE
jgi:hypothetical protein